MRSALLLLVPNLLAITFTAGPKVANVSHGGARLVWISDTHPTSSLITYGPSDPPSGATRTPYQYNNTPLFTGSVNLSGLAPATTYYYKVTLNGTLDGTGSFTTLAEPSPHPVLPTAPTAVDVSMPTIDGNTYNVASDCSDLQTQINTVAALTGALNHQIVIPAGTTCYGHWTFPVKSGTGWTVVRSGAAGGAAFPPAGVRWTTNWPVASTLATFVTRTLGASRGAQTAISLGSGTCATTTNYGGGHFYYVTGLPLAQFPLIRCDDDNAAYTGGTTINSCEFSNPVTIHTAGHSLVEGQIIEMPAICGITAGHYYVYGISGNDFQLKVASTTTGTGTFSVYSRFGLPSHTKDPADPSGACTEETWWYNTTSGNFWWCVQGAWVRFETPGNTTTAAHAAIQVTGSKYRFIGLEVRNQQVAQAPTGYPGDWNIAGNITNTQGQVFTLVEVDDTASNAIFDRCYLHGMGFPSRIATAFRVNAGDFALIESTATNFSHWRTANENQADSAGVVWHYLGNRLLMRNNLVQAAGITYFAPTPCDDGKCPVTDVTAERNTFQKLPAWRETGSQTWVYPNRHAFEVKQNNRLAILGNVFDYSWSGVNNAAFLMLSPKVPYAIPGAYSISSWKDGVIQLSGTAYVQPGDVVYIENTDASHNGLQEVASNSCSSNCTEFTITGTHTGSGSAAGTVKVRAFGWTLKDVDIRNNTFYQGVELWRGSVASNTFYWMPQWGPFRFSNNLSVDMNIRTYGCGGRVDKNGTYSGEITTCGVTPNNFNGPRDIAIMNGDLIDATITHNTYYSQLGDKPTFMVADDVTGDRNEGLTFSDNFYTDDDVAGLTAIRSDGSSGTAALNARFTRGGTDASPTGYWTSTKNVIGFGFSGSSGSYPSGYQWPAAQADVKWLNPQTAAGYDFRLRYDSLYQSGGASRASDDKAIGADIDALEAAQGKVSNARARNIAATTAIVSYLAPDSEACTVEYGTSATWGTGTRTGDGGGGRARSVNLSSLTTGTTYYYRILCAVEQPNGNFKTL